MRDFIEKASLLCMPGWQQVVEQRMTNSIKIAGPNGLDALLRKIHLRKRPPKIDQRLNDKVDEVYAFAHQIVDDTAAKQAEMDEEYGVEVEGTKSLTNLVNKAREEKGRCYVRPEFQTTHVELGGTIDLTAMHGQLEAIADLPHLYTVQRVHEAIADIPETAVSFLEFSALYGGSCVKDLQELVEAQKLVPENVRGKIPWEHLERAIKGEDCLYFEPEMVQEIKDLVSKVADKSDEDLIHPDSLEAYRTAKQEGRAIGVMVKPHGWESTETLHMRRYLQRAPSEVLSSCTFSMLPGKPGSEAWQGLLDMMESWQEKNDKALRIHVEDVITAQDVYAKPEHVLHVGPSWLSKHTALGVIGKTNSFSVEDVDARKERYDRTRKGIQNRHAIREESWASLPSTLDDLASFTPNEHLADVHASTDINGEAPCLYRVRFVAGQGKNLKPFLGYLRKHWEGSVTMGWDVKDQTEGRELIGLTKEELLSTLEVVQQHNHQYDCNITEARSIGKYKENAYRVELQIVSIDRGNYGYDTIDDVWEPGSRLIMEQALKDGHSMQITAVDPSNPKESHSYQFKAQGDFMKTAVAVEGTKQDFILGEVEMPRLKHYGALQSYSDIFGPKDERIATLQAQVLEHNQSQPALQLRVRQLL